MRQFLALFLLALFAAVVHAQPADPAQDPRQDPRLQDASKLRMLVMALHSYTQDYEGNLPPDLASTLDYLGANNADQASRVKNISDTLIAPGVPASKVPADAKADWVNQNASYAYLGGPGIKLDEVPSWSDLVIAHLRLDAGHPSPDAPNDPNQEMFTLAFVDGHVELTTRSEATRLINESRQIFDAIRSGAAFPDATQALWDLSFASAAIRAYAKAHNDQLPPDLGSALAYVPTQKPRLATPVQRAAVFLSPNARRNTHIPDQPTPEWLNRNASYVYLAAAPTPDAKPLLLSRIEDQTRMVLLHTRLDAGVPVHLRGGQEATVFPISSFKASPSLQTKEYAEPIITETKKVLDATRRHTPLPDYQAMLRDLRLLNKALVAYAAANKGELPTDLSGLLPFLPDDELPTPADKARTFLAPRAKRLAHLPDDLTQEWVAKNATYAFPAGGKPALQFSKLRQDGTPVAILIHAPIDEAVDVLFSSGLGPPSTQPTIPTATTAGVEFTFKQRLEEDIAQSRQLFDAQRAK